MGSIRLAIGRILEGPQQEAVQVIHSEREVADQADEKPISETREQPHDEKVTWEEPQVREALLLTEPTEFEKALHVRMHSPPCIWCANCTRGKGRDDAHHRAPVAERVTEDTEDLDRAPVAERVTEGLHRVHEGSHQT